MSEWPDSLRLQGVHPMSEVPTGRPVLVLLGEDLYGCGLLAALFCSPAGPGNSTVAGTKIWDLPSSARPIAWMELPPVNPGAVLEALRLHESSEDFHLEWD